MSRFLDFEINEQLEKIFLPTKIITQQKLKNFPSDIKNHITEQFFLHNKEWWYSQEEITRLKYHGSIYALSYCLNNRLIIGHNHNRIKTLNLLTDKIEASLWTESSVYALTIDPTEQILVYGLGNGKVRAIQLDSPRKELFSFSASAPVWSLSLIIITHCLLLVLRITQYTLSILHKKNLNAYSKLTANLMGLHFITANQS